MKFLKESDSIEIIQWIEEIAQELKEVERIEVSFGGAHVELEPMQETNIQIFPRRRGGTLVHARELGGGLSSARTLRLRVEGETGALATSVVGKLASIPNIQNEYRRFTSSVSPKLLPGFITSHVDSVRAGSWSVGGVFYQLADGYDESLFDV